MTRRAWSIRGRVCAVPLAALLLLLAASAAVADNPDHLSNPTVSPRHAEPGQAVSFGVIYTDSTGAGPKLIEVVVGSSTQPLTRLSGSFADGATYGVTAVVPAGRYAVDFVATTARGARETQSAGWISVSGDPAPSATPTAPAPGSSVSDGDAVGGGGEVGGGATAAPGPADPGAPLVAPTPAVAPTAAAAPTAVPATPASPGTGDAMASSGAGSSAAPGGAIAGGLASGDGSTGDGSSGDGTNGDGSSAGGVAPTTGPSAFGALGPIAMRAGGASANPDGSELNLPSDLPLPQLLVQLAPTMATTTAATTAWAAFLIFGRRRRDGAPPAPDEVLAAAAATGIDAPAAPGLSVTGGMPGPAPGALGTPGRPAVPDESLLPRWRRPSLMAARKADPLRANVERTSMTFDGSGVYVAADAVRRRIRYRLVRLLDSPDELRSAEIGILDQGDEVELLERSGAYWRVLCPDGREGWLHRMTLADPDPLAERADDPRLQAIGAARLADGPGRGPATRLDLAWAAEAERTGSGDEAAPGSRPSGGLDRVAPATEDISADNLLDAYLQAHRHQA